MPRQRLAARAAPEAVTLERRRRAKVAERIQCGAAGYSIQSPVHAIQAPSAFTRLARPSGRHVARQKHARPTRVPTSHLSCLPNRLNLSFLWYFRFFGSG